MPRLGLGLDLDLALSAGAWLGGIPATVIRQRDGAVIYDRSGATISLRS